MKQDNAISATRRFADGIRWWLSELACLVPTSLKRTMTAPGDVTMIAIGKDNAMITHFDAGGGEDTVEQSLETLASLPVSEDNSREMAQIAVAPGNAYIQRFQVPAVAQAKLKQAVAFEVERRSPFRKDDSVFDYTVVDKSADGKTLTIEWATVPSQSVRMAEDTARKLGYFPLAVGLLAGDPKELRYVFTRQKTAASFRMGGAGFILLISFLFVVGAGAYASYEHFEKAQSLNDAAEDLKTKAETARKATADAQKLVASINSIIAQTHEPKILDILREVTLVLPDDTWVSQFDLRGDQLRLVGFSTAASVLPEKLATVAMFDHPHFGAPITQQTNPQDPKTTLEHFDIAVTIRDRHKAEAK